MTTDIIILALLNQGPRYGYDIKKHVSQIMGRQTSMNNNLLYPALHRLKEMGAVRCEIQAQEGRPNKHVYSIAPVGAEILRDLVGQFDEPEAAKDDEFQVRLAFFDLLDDPEKLRILGLRRKILDQRLEHRRTLQGTYAGDYESPWLERLMAFEQNRLVEEIAWVQELERAVGSAGGAA